MTVVKTKVRALFLAKKVNSPILGPFFCLYFVCKFVSHRGLDALLFDAVSLRSLNPPDPSSHDWQCKNK